MKKTQMQRRNPNSDNSFPDSGNISLRSGENLTRFDEILPDLVKISPDLREISPESGFLRQILENYCRNLEILAGIQKFWPESGNLLVGSGFSGFRGGKPKLNCQNRFLVVKTHRRPTGAIRSTGFGSNSIGSSGGSGYRINLDSPSLDHFVTWIEETPSFIESAMIHDALLFSHY